MANHLVIYMHPTEDSFNGALLNSYTKTLEEQGDHVVIRSLSAQNFRSELSHEEYKDSLNGIFSPDVRKEHEYLLQADYITFLFPFWWTGFPAVGKGYIDRVFSYGVAYELDGEDPIPLLNGKKAVLIITSGTPENEMKEMKIYSNFLELVDKSIFQFCGLELIKTVYFGNVIQCGNENRTKMLEEVSKVAKKINECSSD
ncbi:NAD(P)H-dependent oxidoreductase [Evansella tamaricis]|uniref:NAD(P)H-dependent oxidoreductase n=1 Tax=Evansella tamaricis TaxID=2069301 RepID=A0ABS6JD01_9BACI|nr:NAD(P)H-dependent oxidoreductase [Evansella tamaricis]MBU9711446.1 NAD(P)H-dependent oxidoreductase [Evansella tamaricis]